jgi:chemotaxis protein CheX
MRWVSYKINLFEYQPREEFMKKTSPIPKASTVNSQREQFKKHFTKKSQPKIQALVPRAEYINPFIESVSELFSTMLDIEVQRQELSLKLELEPSLDIVAFIALSGYIKGTVALSFPQSTALELVSKIYEDKFHTIDSVVVDALGEFANIVAAGAQNHLSQNLEQRIDLGVPTVVRGSCFNINYPSQATWIEIPFISDLGGFIIRVTIKRGDGVQLFRQV